MGGFWDGAAANWSQVEGLFWSGFGCFLNLVDGLWSYIGLNEVLKVKYDF
jgi:hypothetical protein